MFGEFHQINNDTHKHTHAHTHAHTHTENDVTIFNNLDFVAKLFIMIIVI